MNGFPFFSRRKSRATAAQEFRIDDFANDAVRAPFECALQRCVSIGAEIAVDARGIDLSDAAQ